MNRWIVPAALAVFAAACGPGAVGVDIDRDLAAQTVPGDARAHALGVALSAELPGTQAYDDAVNNAAANASVKPPHLALKALTFTIPKTASGDPGPCWDFLNAATLSVQSQRAGSSLPTLEVARATGPGCTDTLDFQPDPTADLRPYLDEGVHFVVHVDGTVPAQDVTFTGHVTLRGAL